MDTGLIKIESIDKVELPVVSSYQLKKSDAEEYYVSAYNDQKATIDETKKIVHEFCKMYNIDITLEPSYLALVIRAEMTHNQLVDAVLHIYETWDDTKYGKPKPAQIVKFDRKKENILFKMNEMVDIAEGMAKKYKKTYDEMYKKFFNRLTDSEGRIIHDKSGRAIFEFTQEGEANKSELLKFINK